VDFSVGITCLVQYRFPLASKKSSFYAERGIIPEKPADSWEGSNNFYAVPGQGVSLQIVDDHGSTAFPYEAEKGNNFFFREMMKKEGCVEKYRLFIFPLYGPEILLFIAYSLARMIFAGVFEAEGIQVAASPDRVWQPA
jgi:hypothetical protein